MAAVHGMQGSTCAMVESILRHAGYRTGLFTSPHLVDVRERIRLDGWVHLGFSLEVGHEPCPVWGRHLDRT